MSFMTLVASATTLPTITLSASSAQLPIILPTGTTVNGSILTIVRFWVSAPNGAQIVNLGLIDKTTTFSFVANQNGNYTMNFENGLTNSIQVTFSYVTDPDILGGSSSTEIPLVYKVISIVIAALGSTLIIFFVRRKNKLQASEVYDASVSSLLRRLLNNYSNHTRYNFAFQDHSFAYYLFFFYGFFQLAFLWLCSCCRQNKV
jgi:hypothetical protein